MRFILSLTATSLLMFSLSPGGHNNKGWGEFSGPVRAEWLDDGRSMRLLEDFAIH
jgi:hypothetical protein